MKSVITLACHAGIKGSSPLRTARSSPAVQTVERLTVNQNVAGSIPAGGAKLNGAVAQQGERYPCTVDVAGSIPVSSTNNNRRVSYSGNTSAFQADAVSSILTTRSNRTGRAMVSSADCKSVALGCDGSTPSLSTKIQVCSSVEEHLVYIQGVGGSTPSRPTM